MLYNKLDYLYMNFKKLNFKKRVSEKSLEFFLGLLAIFIATVAIDLCIIVMLINTGFTFQDIIALTVNNFVYATAQYKLIILYLIIAPFALGILLVNNAKMQSGDFSSVKEHNLNTIIRDIHIHKEGLCFKSKVLKIYDLKIAYYNIESFKIKIKTGIAYNKFGLYSCVYNANITLKDKNNTEYSFYYSPVNIKTLYKLVYYSKYIKHFEYEITGKGTKTKNRLTEDFQKIIKNHYNATLFTRLMNFLRWH